MKKILLILLFILLTINNNAQQLNGVYVLSEGGFSSGTSMLSKINSQNNEFTQNIFNDGDIGLYPDGLIVANENIYLLVQGSFGGSGKLYKLDTSGNVLLSKEVGTNPYSLAYSNNKIYITNGPASSVTVVNESDFTSVKEISVGVYPQEIIAYEGNIYVANNSLWGGDSDSTVTVINSETDEVINTITVKPDPSSLAISNEGDLLIGCPSGIIYEVELQSFAKVDSFEISDLGFGKDICVDKNSDMIYFKSMSNVIAGLNLSTGETEIAVEDNNILFTYGYGYDYISGNHYLTDAKDFSSNGALHIYNGEGVLLNSYETSIAPRRIAFEYGDNTVSVYNEKITSSFRLDQNYPNPFNPTTTIKYSIPSNVKGETSNVKLIIYDILGNEIKTLVNKDQAHGNYSVQFDAYKLSSGIYYYTLTVGNFIETKKMMLLK